MKKNRVTNEVQPGTVVTFEISENRSVFGRILPQEIGIYEFFIHQGEDTPSLEYIIRRNIMIYCSIYTSIVTKGLVQSIGHVPLTNEDLIKIPPIFKQKIGNYRDCRIIWPDGTTKHVSPSECVGLESMTVWDLNSLKLALMIISQGKKIQTLNF